MDRITLDRETFKILASDTRLEILKALDERRKTVTELARELDLNKATVFEHLEKLVQGELVRKIDDERKWVYYDLSWKGKRLLNPERITIALLLSSAVASLATGLTTLWLYVTSIGQGRSGGGAESGGDMGAFAESAPAPDAADAAGGGFLSGDPVLLAATIGLVLLFVTLGVIAFLVKRRAAARPDAGAPVA